MVDGKEVNITQQSSTVSKRGNEIEMQILDDLETTQVFNMRETIRNYIKNNVWLEREGLNLKIKACEKSKTKYKSQYVQMTMAKM